MADIRPFIASRYSNVYSSHLADLLTPPYDVISPELQEKLRNRHPKNFVRIDFAREKPGDNETENKYTRAGKRWAEWKESGTIVPDPKPALYAYEQEFELPGRGWRKRRGFFAAVRLESFSEGGIRAHEHTFDGPKADRLNLMRATNANTSPIFCIYDDPERLTDQALELSAAKAAAQEATIDGVTHRLWAVDSPQTIDAIVTAMIAERLYIADGHHRYETALNYRDEMRKKTGKTGGAEPFDYALMFLCNTHDEGLEILPTHRALSKRACEGIDLGKFLGGLEEAFTVEPLDQDLSDAGKAAAALTAKLAEAGAKSVSFIVILPGGKAHLISLKEGADPEKLIPDKELKRAVKELDVTLLHSYIIRAVLRTGFKEELDDADVSYVKDAADAVRMAASGDHGVAFLLNPTKIEQVINVAGLGMRMPHKSTFFYPKIITGMAIRDMSAQ